MRLRLLPNGDISLTQLHPLEANALLAIPANADPTGTPEAESRLYPSPVDESKFADHDPLEVAATQEDWDEYVVPELRELFEGSVQRVMGNLKQLSPAPPEEEEEDVEDDEEEENGEDEPEDSTDEKLQEEPAELDAERVRQMYFMLTIPHDLAEDWYRAMNQARLVMAEKTLWIADNGDLHGPFLSQIHYEIYTHIQGWLVEHVLWQSEG